MLFGFIDVASHMDLPRHKEDFGQTLGYWGTPSGPYLVLPVYGPSTVRDGVGRLADSAGTFYFSFLPLYSTLGVRSLEVVNLRAEFFEEIGRTAGLLLLGLSVASGSRDQPIEIVA